MSDHPISMIGASAFDVAALDRAVAVEHEPAGHAEGCTTRRLAKTWRAVLTKDPTAVVQARELARVAHRCQAPAAVIEATALRALAHLSAGETAAATAAARTAARMARTEALPEPETLASLVLARLRRYAGKGHLALWILSAVARWAAPPWRAWLRWEEMLAGAGRAGDMVPAAQEAATPAALASGVLGELLAAAIAGDRPLFEVRASELLGVLAACPLFRDEATDVLAALDPHRPASATVQAWRRGDEARPPAGFYGQREDDPARAAAYVLATPEGTSGRVLGAGLALHDPEGPRPQTVGADRRQVRALTGLCVLALAGPAGLERAAFVQKVYGFPYDPAVHDGLLHVLVHRMRGAVAGVAEIERPAGAFVLVPRRPLFIPDPRCAPPDEADLIRWLARTGPASTATVAQALNLPVRTAQALLRRLVADGACRELRDGRNLRYEVEDTTFTQPTPFGRG